MNSDAHVFPLRSWTAIATGLAFCGLGLAGLLYNLVLLTTHLWCLWLLSALSAQMAHALMGQVSPLMLALNLSGGGLFLTLYGLQLLPPPNVRGDGDFRSHA